DLPVDVGLVLAHPGDLGGGEAGHGDIARHRPQAGKGRFHLGAFGGGAPVIPQDAGAQHRVVLAQQRRPVHVTGKADAAHRRQFLWMALFQGVDGGEGGGPPVGGVLLGPAGAGPHRLDGGRRSLAQGLAMGVDQQRLDAGRADINAEIGHEARTSILPDASIAPSSQRSISAYLRLSRKKIPISMGSVAAWRAVPSARVRAAAMASRISPSGFWSSTTSMAPSCRPARVGAVSSWAMTRMLPARPEASSAATSPALPAPRL